MKKLILVFVATFMLANVAAQEKETKLYNPEADAKVDIKKAIAKAKKEGKHVLLQVGGNWCGWCILFDKKVKANDTLSVPLKSNYVSYHLNYSQENMNEDVLAKIGYPQRFGFPVFVILDGNGKRLHTQNSAYLEEGRGHSTRKVLDFFNAWSPKAIDPASYKPRK